MVWGTVMGNDTLLVHSVGHGIDICQEKPRRSGAWSWPWNRCLMEQPHYYCGEMVNVALTPDQRKAPAEANVDHSLRNDTQPKRTPET